MISYATTTDVIAYKGAISAGMMERMDKILETCSAELRLIAKRQGKDLDQMIADDEDIAVAVTKGVVDSSVNYYYASENREPIMTQFSQAAGGYSFSGTLANAGGAFYFPKKFLRDIGLSTQKIGTIEVFDYGIND